MLLAATAYNNTVFISLSFHSFHLTVHQIWFDIKYEIVNEISAEQQKRFTKKKKKRNLFQF